MADPERELVIARLINAPRERIFAAWTDPKQLARWWGPHGMTTPVCEMDLRPGGVFRTVMRDRDGTEYPQAGVFLKLVAPERIVLTDAFGAGWQTSAQAFTTAIVTLEPEDGRTRYTARALHWSAGDREKHEAMGFHQGWGESLDRLEQLVTKA
jgi:uncharacterized protein YndB with AHSA1/START domain